MKTFLSFIYTNKAFDTVPHMARLLKLHWIGVHGRPLAFIEALCTGRPMAVRGGGSTYTSEILRGIRQGHNLALRQLYLWNLGQIRGMRCSRPCVEDELAGFMFVDDDLVIVAGSLE